MNLDSCSDFPNGHKYLSTIGLFDLGFKKVYALPAYYICFFMSPPLPSARCHLFPKEIGLFVVQEF